MNGTQFVDYPMAPQRARARRPRWIVLAWVALLLLLLAIALQAQTPLAGRLDRAIRAAGVPIVGVSIGDATDRRTWRVSPSSLQGAAQPTIDAFDPEAASLLAAELDAEAQQTALPRPMRAWMLFYLRDKLGRNPTLAERQAARDAFVAAYKDVGP